MSDAALLAVPRSFEHKGNRYVVCYRDLFTELAFADWVKAEAGLTLARMRPRWPADFYAEQMRLLNSKIVSKQIQWGTPDVHAAYWSEEGQRHMLYLKMQRGAETEGGEPLERSLIDDIAKDTAKWQELLDILWQQDEPDFFAALQKERKAAAKTTPSQPASSPPAAPDSTPKV